MRVVKCSEGETGQSTGGDKPSLFPHTVKTLGGSHSKGSIKLAEIKTGNISVNLRKIKISQRGHERNMCKRIRGTLLVKVCTTSSHPKHQQELEKAERRQRKTIKDFSQHMNPHKHGGTHPKSQDPGELRQGGSRV